MHCCHDLVNPGMRQWWTISGRPSRDRDPSHLFEVDRGADCADSGGISSPPRQGKAWHLTGLLESESEAGW